MVEDKVLWIWSVHRRIEWVANCLGVLMFVAYVILIGSDLKYNLTKKVATVLWVNLNLKRPSYELRKKTTVEGFRIIGQTTDSASSDIDWSTDLTGGIDVHNEKRRVFRTWT